MTSLALILAALLADTPLLPASGPERAVAVINVGGQHR